MVARLGRGRLAGCPLLLFLRRTNVQEGFHACRLAKLGCRCGITSCSFRAFRPRFCKNVSAYGLSVVVAPAPFPSTVTRSIRRSSSRHVARERFLRPRASGACRPYERPTINATERCCSIKNQTRLAGWCSYPAAHKASADLYASPKARIAPERKVDQAVVLSGLNEFHAPPAWAGQTHLPGDALRLTTSVCRLAPAVRRGSRMAVLQTRAHPPEGCGIAPTVRGIRR